MNISKFSNIETANTNYICALQRAENLAILNCKNVIELCVGPSLKVLEKAYKKYNIECFGNDIDKRWEKYYKEGKWIIGDALKVDTSNFDAVVFAPPLSKNCSGIRKDALSIVDIKPNYNNFLKVKSKICVYVLPGKTLSIKSERKLLYKFLSNFKNYNIAPLKNKVNKYIDVYVEK